MTSQIADICADDDHSTSSYATAQSSPADTTTLGYSSQDEGINEKPYLDYIDIPSSIPASSVSAISGQTPRPPPRQAPDMLTLDFQEEDEIAPPRLDTSIKQSFEADDDDGYSPDTTPSSPADTANSSATTVHLTTHPNISDKFVSVSLGNDEDSTNESVSRPFKALSARSPSLSFQNMLAWSKGRRRRLSEPTDSSPFKEQTSIRERSLSNLSQTHKEVTVEEDELTYLVRTGIKQLAPFEEEPEKDSKTLETNYRLEVVDGVIEVKKCEDTASISSADVSQQPTSNVFATMDRFEFPECELRAWTLSELEKYRDNLIRIIQDDSTKLISVLECREEVGNQHSELVRGIGATLGKSKMSIESSRRRRL